MVQLSYDQKLIDSIKDKLAKHQQTVSTAESVTAGHLQVCFSLAGQSSLIFQGGITAYNIIQKCTHLDVNISDAVAANCVSEQIASQMAEKACDLFSSTWALAITGYATAMPPFTDEGLFACYAIAGNKKTVRRGTLKTKQQQALNVQLDYTNQLLKIFRDILNRKK